jgi:hypothetical protein
MALSFNNHNQTKTSFTRQKNVNRPPTDAPYAVVENKVLLLLLTQSLALSTYFFRPKKCNYDDAPGQVVEVHHIFSGEEGTPYAH